MYALDAEGRRQPCPHPNEFATVKTVTGLDYQEARQRGLTGFSVRCYCPECREHQDTDLEREGRRCQACDQDTLRTGREMVGQPCPLCQGTIEQGNLSRPKINLELQKLEIPPLIDEIFEFLERRSARQSESLEQMIQVLKRRNWDPAYEGYHDLYHIWSVSQKLFREQMPLEHCPALAALFWIQKKQFFYRDEVSLEQRQAIAYHVNRRYSWPDMT